MRPLRQHMLAALHLPGKRARTQEPSVRAVRLLAQCSQKSPDRLAAQALQRSFLPRQTVDGLAPASRRLCDRGLRFFSHPVLTREWDTRTLLRPQSPPGAPPSAVGRRSGGSCTWPPPCPPTSRAPPSIASAAGAMRPSAARARTGRARAARGRSLVARAPTTGTAPCPKSPWRCSVLPGQPRAPLPGAVPPPGGIPANVRPPRPRCLAPVSRGPVAPPHTGLVTLPTKWQTWC